MPIFFLGNTHAIKAFRIIAEPTVKVYFVAGKIGQHGVVPCGLPHIFSTFHALPVGSLCAVVPEEIVDLGFNCPSMRDGYLKIAPPSSSQIPKTHPTTVCFNLPHLSSDQNWVTAYSSRFHLFVRPWA